MTEWNEVVDAVVGWLREEPDPTRIRENLVRLRTSLEGEWPPDAAAGVLIPVGDEVLAHFHRTRIPDLLDLAYELAGHVVRLARMPEIRVTALTLLGEVCGDRYRNGAGVVPLREAIDAYRQADDLAAVADPGMRFLCLSGLGTCLSWSWEIGGPQEQLTEALACHRAAVALAGAGDRLRALGDLGRTLLRAYRGDSEPGTLDEANEVLERALTLAPPGSSVRAGLLSDQAAVLQERYEAGTTPGPADLERAVDRLRETVLLTPPGTRGRELYLSNLGQVLTGLYQLTEDSRLLDEAVTVNREALDTTSQGEVEYPRRLYSLCSALDWQAHHRRDPEPLDEVIRRYREALAATPEDHGWRASYLANLAMAVGDPLVLDENPEAQLTEAIGMMEEAQARFASGERHDRARSNLAILIARRARATRPAEAITSGEADLENGIRIRSELLAEMPENARGRGNQHFGLAQLLLERYQTSRAQDDVRRALDHLAHAVADPHLPLLVRARSAVTRSDLCHLAGDLPGAARAAGEAVGMLPALLARDLTPADQAYVLEQFPQIACDAAALTLRNGGDAQAALNLLEQGRAILLSRERPAAARRSSGPLPGTVAVITVSRYGCHALLTDGTNDRVIDLDGVKARDVWSQAARFLRGLEIVGNPEYPDDVRVNAGEQHAETLRWMWDHIAEPVLGALGLDHRLAPGEPLPRLWWVPTGALGLLPLHAAGHHTDGTGRTVLDRVVSSYTPTLAALRDLPAAAPRSPARTPKVLAIGIARTEGMRDLPGTAAELAAVQALFPQSTILADEFAQRGLVVDRLRDSEWVHLACHAVSDPEQPSASHLMLSDGPLSVSDIAALSAEDAYLAYLSACSSARGSSRLPDEALHLSAAFHTGGYRHVIGSLWSIVDDVAVGLAEAFYTRMAAAPWTVEPARALHAATRELRDRYGGRSPLLWAAYIHTGN